MQKIVEKYRKIKQAKNDLQPYFVNRVRIQQKGKKKAAQLAIRPDIWREFTDICINIFGVNSKTMILHDIIQESKNSADMLPPNGLDGWTRSVCKLPVESVGVLQKHRFNHKKGKPTHAYWLADKIQKFNQKWRNDR